MKMIRRKFITGLSCGLACALAQPASRAAAQTSAVLLDICTTIDSISPDFSFQNFSPNQRRILERFQFTDFGTLIFTKRWLRTDGLTPNTGKITLGCCFLNGNQGQHSRIEKYARRWLEGDLGQFIDFRFGVDIDSSQIRIVLGQGGNNSYIGRDNLSRKLISKPTMHLTNYNRSSTVQHEFGHALGLLHEHLSPGAIEFREDAVLRDMGYLGWTEAQTRNNILSPLHEYARCIGDPNMNEKSIMMYSIPRTWTKNGKSYYRSGYITNRDRNCLTAVYAI